MRTRVTRITGIPYVERNGVPLYADLAIPVGFATLLPVVLVVHGGGWCTGDRTQKAAEAMRLSRTGLVTVTIDYRLAPEHPYPASIDDMRAAAQWIRENIGKYGGDALKIGAYGVSAGGHLVALLATDADTQLHAAVSWGGPMDLRSEAVTPAYRGYLLAFLASCIHEAPARYIASSPLTRLSPSMPPMLFVHGTNDQVVPMAQTARMVQAAAQVGAPVEALFLDGAPHEPGDLRDPGMASAWERITAFLHEKLCLSR